MKQNDFLRRVNLYKKRKDLHIKIHDTVSHTNESIVQIKKVHKYSSFRVLLITSFQTKYNTKTLP